LANGEEIRVFQRWISAVAPLLEGRVWKV